MNKIYVTRVNIKLIPNFILKNQLLINGEDLGCMTYIFFIR